MTSSEPESQRTGTGAAPVTRCLAPSFLPATAVLEMTYRCNHACLFCSCPWFAPGGAYDLRPEMDPAAWKALVARLCRLGVMNLAFTGGEPLLKEGLREILTFAATCPAVHVETRDGSLVTEEKPPKIHLLTNGKLLADEWLDFCAAHGIHVGISLPGLSTFAEHTAGGDVAKTAALFAKTRERGISTHAGVTVTRRNLPELYETLAECLLRGADSLLLNRFLPGGRGLANTGALALDANDIRQMLEIAETVLAAAGRTGNTGTEIPLCVADPARYPHVKVGVRCSAALDFFVVDPSGYLRVCNHSPVRLAHVDRLETVKDHPYWRRFVLRDYLPAACVPCPDAGRCDAGCREAAHIARGAVDALDPVLADPPPGVKEVRNLP